MSKINELEAMINKSSEIGRRSHFQVKGRLSQLEKKLQKMEHTIFVLQQEQSTLNKLLKDFYTEFPGYKAG